MGAKSKLGMGLKKKKKPKTVTLRKVIEEAKRTMIPSNDTGVAIRSALKGAQAAVKRAGGKRNVRTPRILPVPSKVGGFLPFLVPVFAGLSAAGALAGGAAGIAKAVNDANASKEQLKESQRHNETIEAIALGKGLYLKPYKKGQGLYLKPKNLK
ncbi:uncharacterized protein LOC107272286 [Cephus cinctus]|uniref:Uncharacterized protein LOC107272286 n=1 Tax=Cephus cinctus TaxID=211228 RepID=A0AAJ7C8X1_CEPCN|nr:uncharacterized protein LOC107272286 [Cephus cinctus]